MKPPSGPKKTNPNKPNFRKAKMNLKSLAGKSGHTRLMDLAIPVGIADVKKKLAKCRAIKIMGAMAD